MNRFKRKPHRAFTLAEVLITLGVIGIVAAMTLPSVLTNYKRKTLSSKLQKFASALTQGFRKAKFDNGEVLDELEANDPESAYKIVTKYYTPYLISNDVVKGEKGVFVYLQDNTAFYFRRTSKCRTIGWGCTYIYFCPTQKVCKEIDENNLGSKLGNKYFIMYTGGIPTYGSLKQNLTRDELYDNCKNSTTHNSESCTQLIMLDNWTVKSDYPRPLEF